MKKLLKIVGGVFLSFFLLGVIATACGDDGATNEPAKEVVADGTDRAEPPQEVEKAAEPKKEKEEPKEEVKEEKAPEPKEVKEEEPKKEEPEEAKMTLAQENAVSKAQDYLNYTAFSKTGLAQQLEYEGFESADADFAVNNITVDWNAQAVQKAKDYMDYSSFSRDGLIQQLEYEGFTTEQATHAVDEIGL